MLQKPDWLEPMFSWRQRQLTVNGRRMAYLDEGQEDARPVLLLHGNPNWGFLYRDFPDLGPAEETPATSSRTTSAASPGAGDRSADGPIGRGRAPTWPSSSIAAPRRAEQRDRALPQSTPRATIRPD